MVGEGREEWGCGEGGRSGGGMECTIGRGRECTSGGGWECTREGVGECTSGGGRGVYEWRG